MADEPGVNVITVVVLPPGHLWHSFVTVVTLYWVPVFVITVVEIPPRHSGQGTVRVVTLVSVTVVDPPPLVSHVSLEGPLERVPLRDSLIDPGLVHVGHTVTVSLVMWPVQVGQSLV